MSDYSRVPRPSRDPSHPLRPPGELIDVGGHRLHAILRGAGAPLVMLEAGIAASSLSWTLVQPGIAAFTRSCAYDRAGLGWSDAASSPRNFARICDDFDGVRRDVHGDGRAILVGHSFGSLVVRAVAARAPQRVAGLVLIDPPTEWLDPGPEQVWRLTRAIRLSRLGALLARVGFVRLSLALVTSGRAGAARGVARAFGATAAQTLERLVGEIRKLPPDLHPAVRAHWCQPKAFRAMADYLRVMREEAAVIGAAAPAPDVPVVVISGAHQPAAEVARHRAMAGASRAGRHVIAGRSGHWILFDQPDLIVSAVRTLVDRERSRRARLISVE